MSSPEATEQFVSTGVPGLDSVLAGGFPPDGVYLVEGEAGAGKTTLGLQFLLEGVRRGEPVLHITLSETEAELKTAARSHGLSLEGINIFEMLPSDEQMGLEGQYTMFHPSEVELGESTRKILDMVERTGARRVVIDSLAEMRLLAQGPLWLRRQILSMKRFFAERHCTVLLLEDLVENVHTRTIVQGVIQLQQLVPVYGGHRRRLRVLKLRGKTYLGGYHDFAILTGGVQVFTRLIAMEHRKQVSGEGEVRSGLPELDALTGGGLTRGTSALLMGPSGTGKSSLTSRYLFNLLEEGEKAAVFLFDENPDGYLVRARGLGMDFSPHLESGAFSLQQVDPAELAPGEFAAAVTSAVEQGASMVAIDSLTGYFYAMPGENFLMLHMHELLTSLGQRGVTTLVVVAQHGLLGADMYSTIDLSYLTDAVILLRYFEAEGKVRQAISVMKKRSGAHERTVRELKLEAGGMRISEPLYRFQGILSGNPDFTGPAEKLMSDDE